MNLESKLDMEKRHSGFVLHITRIKFQKAAGLLLYIQIKAVSVCCCLSMTISNLWNFGTLKLHC